MIVATLLHFCVFNFWPEMTAADVSIDSEEFTAIELPPEIEIPPPPQAIARPATPVIASADIEDHPLTGQQLGHLRRVAARGG